MTAEYAALVYDLDGTLVDLDVDWDAARRDAAAVLRARGVDTDGMTLWELLEHADEAGYRRPVGDAIADHERKGARTSTRLAAADGLPADVPVGVCSLNAESAVRIALEMHGIDGHVDAVVGRDPTLAYKPDPAPLLETVRRLGEHPEEALFVGDSDRDAEAAQRAGVDYRDVEAWLAD
ncbi:HAD family hydrolase [Halobacteriales archaeon Cl-PHB]